MIVRCCIPVYLLCSDRKLYCFLASNLNYIVSLLLISIHFKFIVHLAWSLTINGSQNAASITANSIIYRQTQSETDELSCKESNEG